MNTKIKKLFEGREAVIATMHKKEEIIAPLLECELGTKVDVIDHFNTDLYGTFTNEVKRLGDQLQAARSKAYDAMQQSGVSIGISSEGSFGPHPQFPFISFNRELVLLLDLELDLEIIGYVANTETNYAHKEITNVKEAVEFAFSVGFPQHGVIVKKTKDTTRKEEIIKEITNVQELEKAISMLKHQSQKPPFIETDMRAMNNPTRMKNIEMATKDLISKINCHCPRCDSPGYEIVEQFKGLPCVSCGLPTNSIKSYLMECKKCKHKETVLFPNGKKYADPMYCGYCNP